MFHFLYEEFFSLGKNFIGVGVSGKNVHWGRCVGNFFTLGKKFHWGSCVGQKNSLG